MSQSKPRVLAELRPHPLAFAGHHILWIYVATVSAILNIYHDTVASWASDLPLIGGYVGDYAPYAVWGVLLVVPLLVVSILTISWRYFIVGLLVAAGLPLILRYVGWPYRPYLYFAGIAVGLLGILSTELHRRAHVYLVTDRGIVMEYRGLRSRRREILYSRITDLVMEKPLLGKIFGFGNIVPITGSGMGLGEDESAVITGVGAGRGAAAGVAVAGSRSVSVPRARTFYMLYAVPKPDRVYDIIVEAMRGTEEAPYLKKILETLEAQKRGPEGKG